MAATDDEVRLKTKVHVGDCISARADDYGYISDVSEITVYTGKEHCF